MSGVTRVLKRAGEKVLTRSGLPAASRARRRDRGLVLAYHNVLPSGGDDAAGERSLHVPRRDFGRQLDALARTHEVVGLDALLAEDTPRHGRPRAAVTFDDAYRGAVTAGVDELAARGMPATVFVAPALLGGRSFWWDALLTEAAEETDRIRGRAIGELGGGDAEVRRWAADRGLSERTVPGSHRSATPRELGAAATRPGVTLAPHGWRHRNLVTLPDERLSNALSWPLRWLQERFPEVTRPVLSYPYGRVSSRVVEAARAVGYRAAFRIGGGWLAEDADDRFRLPRISVPAGVSPEGFELRVSGVIDR